MEKEKKTFPEAVTKRVNKNFIALKNSGFFDDKNEFPDKESIELGKINLWNMLGESLLDKYLNNSEFSEMRSLIPITEMEKILQHTIIQTNLDMLISDGLVDGIENEHGEMVYWLTKKGKEIHKGLDN